MEKSISITTNINSTSVAETILRKEYTQNEVKKQAAKKYGVPEHHVTITSIENAVMGLFTATGTFDVSLKKYLLNNLYMKNFKLTTPIILGIISLVDVIVNGGGVALLLWFLYGCYKLLISD